MSRYTLKVRYREQHLIHISGGYKIGPHRRLVTRWSEWRALATADGPIVALQLLDGSPKAPNSERAIFCGRQRMTDEQVRARAKERGGGSQ